MKQDKPFKHESGSIELISMAVILAFVAGVLVYFLVPMLSTLSNNAQSSADKNTKEIADCVGDTCVDCVPGGPDCHMPLPTPTPIGTPADPGGGGGLACACFSGDTLILLANGTFKAIESIAVGDMVLATNDTSSPEIEVPGPQMVERVFVHRKSEFLRLQFETETIDTTPEHRFFARDKGWIIAENLSVGDLLISAEGKHLPLLAKETIKQDITVYNLEVEKAHTFFVGESTLWVHNMKGGGMASNSGPPPECTN